MPTQHLFPCILLLTAGCATAQHPSAGAERATVGREGARSTTGLPPAGEILKEIERKGAKAVVAHLWALDAQWDELCRHIQSGALKWLHVARALRPGTDAGASKTVEISLVLALPESPENVLRFVTQLLPLKSICTPPHIEPEPGEMERWVQRSLGALEDVRSPELSAQRDACRVLLQQSLQPTTP